jgi:hypothetical protein
VTQAPYSYADNDPLNGTDPAGLFCILGHNPNGSCRGSNVKNVVHAVHTAATDVAGVAAACSLVPGADVVCSPVAAGATAVAAGTGVALRVTGGETAESNLQLALDLGAAGATGLGIAAANGASKAVAALRATESELEDAGLLRSWWLAGKAGGLEGLSGLLRELAAGANITSGGLSIAGIACS